MRRAPLLLAAIVLVALSGCGGSSKSKTTRTTATHAVGALGPLKVAIVPVTWGVGPAPHGNPGLHYTVYASRDSYARLEIDGRAGPGSTEMQTVPLNPGNNPEVWRGYVNPASPGVVLKVTGYTNDGARDIVTYTVPLDRSRKGP